MSKKYDEYSKYCTEEAQSFYLIDKKKKPMIPMRVDENLRRELRDRFLMKMVQRYAFLDEELPYKPNQYTKNPERDNSIIMVVKQAILKDIDLTYGELLFYVDGDDSELQYERSKGINGSLHLI